MDKGFGPNSVQLRGVPMYSLEASHQTTTSHLAVPLHALHPGLASDIVADVVVFAVVNDYTSSFVEYSGCSRLEAVHPIRDQLLV